MKRSKQKKDALNQIMAGGIVFFTVMATIIIGAGLNLFDIIKVKHDEIEFNKDNKYKGE